jgi:hypothetical protein
MAEQALAEISKAVETFREANDARGGFYEAQLSRAGRLIEGLRGR